MANEKQFPEGMVPLGENRFSFRCHPGVSCFTVCCQNVDLDLYPYDIVRLKRALRIDSETFLRKYTELKQGVNPYFPTLKLRLSDFDAGNKACPFLKEAGCTVYKHRPTACRTYPLERAVDRSSSSGGRPDEYYFLTDHPYCKGHLEDHYLSVKQWIRNQWLDDYNLMNDLWSEVDTLFALNPWKGEGAGGEKQQLAFLVCYNIDGFRQFTEDRNLLIQYRLDRDFRNRIKRDDVELLKFGFEWLKSLFGGKTSLVLKK